VKSANRSEKKRRTKNPNGGRESFLRGSAPGSKRVVRGENQKKSSETGVIVNRTGTKWMGHGGVSENFKASRKTCMGKCPKIAKITEDGRKNATNPSSVEGREQRRKR